MNDLRVNKHIIEPPVTVWSELQPAGADGPWPSTPSALGGRQGILLWPSNPPESEVHVRMKASYTLSNWIEQVESEVVIPYVCVLDYEHVASGSDETQWRLSMLIKGVQKRIALGDWEREAEALLAAKKKDTDMFDDDPAVQALLALEKQDKEDRRRRAQGGRGGGGRGGKGRGRGKGRGGGRGGGGGNGRGRGRGGVADPPQPEPPVGGGAAEEEAGGAVVDPEPWGGDSRYLIAWWATLL